jgi:hypothetical protein
MANKQGATKTTVVKGSRDNITVQETHTIKPSTRLTDKEIKARQIKKYATTTFGFGAKTAFSGGDVSMSSQGNFYSPQLSTDFLEKPQNLRERRAWYRQFYNGNEFVRAAIDLHSTLPLSKIRLEKPKCKNEDMGEYIYTFFEDMCNDINLFKVLREMSHEYALMGNVFSFAEEHDPYNVEDSEKEKIKEEGKDRALMLYEKFKIRDKDPNYKGWKKIIILPPDQVRIKKMPLTDDSLVEFMPDPDTKKMISGQQDRIYGQPQGANEQFEKLRSKLPASLIGEINEGGSVPMDTDPYTGSFVFHLARKKSQYETLGVSMLECCINTLLLQDKLRQAQTSIASRHMTPIRIVWGEELSEDQTNELREQVDMALVDPDFSIIANYQVNWEEMGSGGRLLELSSEYDHIENSLFAGLNVTREMLTGEGTYSGNKITLHIMNNIYMNFRDDLQEYVENYLFKPVAYKKGFVEKDKFGREKLIYPRLTFTRLAIKDNDAYFDQLFQLYQKGSVSVDVILDIFNIDPVATKKKLESDLFTVNDPTFNTFLQALYNSAGTDFVSKFDINSAIAKYLNIPELPPQQQSDAAGGLGGLGGTEGGASRFAATLSKDQKVAMDKLIKLAAQNPDKLDKLTQVFKKKQF